MVKKNTNQSIKNKLIIQGIQLVGNAAGVNASKYRTKKAIEKNLSLVNSLMRAGFTHKNNSESNLNKNIELAGLGGIALYNFYKGIKRKQRALIIQGAFLSTALLFVVLTSNKLSRKTTF
ncbi:hypothetical protein [Pedobacter jamesrossensis]|uniref:Uncharacterized protein n=1 Tax=Pedobacter jamesrossensis TaxID=1908238 RepID=A0ABV8NMI1_9SPHI